MTNDLSRTTVLVAGNLHPHAVKRLADTFDIVRLEKADPAAVTRDLAARVRGVAAATGVGAAFIDALPDLQIVANFGVGYDGIDSRHCATRGIMVTNTPDVLTDEVADTAVGLLINAIRELPRAEAYLREGKWSREGAYPLTRLTLRGRKVGIFGMGRIGRAIAQRLEAFGLPISYHNRSQVAGVAYAYHPSLLSLAKAVDTLVSVAPGGAATDKAVNAEILEALGPDGVFVNIGRGSTVDEPALIEALRAGTIAAAGLDVFETEPGFRTEFLSLPTACLLPHVGSASVHTRQAMADLVVDNLIGWFENGRAVTPVAETRDVTPSR